jgi:putative salt-induced outer membrane protein
MNTPFRRIIAACILYAGLLLPGLAIADQLIMKNGDVITGDVSKVESDKVFIKPTYTDEFSIDLAEVASIEADQVFEVELEDGSQITAHFAGAQDEQQVLIVDGAEMNIGVMQLTQAREPDAEVVIDPWEGTGELGFVNTTGNTETVNLNFRFNLVRTGESWRHRFTGTALNTSEDGRQDNERYTVEVQSDRKLNDRSWLFGAFRWDADKFGSYDPQVTLTAGYGYQLMKSDKHQLKGEAGAGYRKLTETVSRLSETEIIARFLLDDSWQVFRSTLWTNRLLVETGSSNTFTQFNTALAFSMTDTWAVKLGFEVRNNTKIPPDDSVHTDTITSANIVYNF